jgi:protein-L-isoaspartate(D-aspartate) O-methyltransferase
VDRSDLINELAREIGDQRVLEAMAEVPRDLFVPEPLRAQAWFNVPLPIGEDQTISQPLVVAEMCELLELEPDDLVLDVGTGSGYHAAVLSRLASKVVSIERHRSLSEAARTALDAAGIDNVDLVVGDGSLGWPALAPYDRINVAAACDDGPPQPLIDQLVDGGRMVIPGGRRGQRLLLVCRSSGRVTVKKGVRVRFVPLIEDEDATD